MASFPLWAAIQTVKSKIGTWVGYEQYTEVDPTVTRQQWGTYIGEARAALANRVAEFTRPLNRRPVAGEITPYTNPRAGRVTASGYLQYIDIYVRDAQTGVVTPRPWAIRTDTLMSRASVINQGLSRFEAATLPEGTFEGEEVLGASYAGTVQFIPTEEEF
jgi:hypothetical protein